MDVLVAHLGGGDTVFGNADDPIRFAVSKLSHIHFALSRQYADNIAKVGEEDFRIFWTGNPSLDTIKNTKRLSLEEIGGHLGIEISDGKFLVFIKHPLSSEQENTTIQIDKSLRALEQFCGETGYQVIGSYPNTDPGAYDILNAIEGYRDHPSIHFFKTLPRDIFINLMRYAKALVGNSSMGILEAPFYGLPVVNIGNRQKGRLNAGNARFVGYNVDDIREELERACLDEDYRKRVAELENPFGDGDTAHKIVEILKGINAKESRWHIKNKLC